MEGIIKPVYWTARSIKDLEKITRFNAMLFGFKKAILIATELRESTEILESHNFKEIGAVDEDFVHLKYEYRKLIHHHCKITYREVNQKFILIEFLIPDKTRIKINSKSLRFNS